jgi:putative component of membrane protein insertase Oxa1/YidC/SpoIIIJ protein YidD
MTTMTTEAAKRAAAAAVVWASAGSEQLRPVRVWWLNPVTWLLIGAVAAYRRAVPDAGKPECRFTPSCSRYATLALKKYGAVGGVRATARRLRRCGGFGTRSPVADWP